MMSQLPSPNLSLGAQRLTEAACRKKVDSQHAYLGLNHWLLALIERHPAMIESISSGFNVQIVRKQVIEQLQRNEPGLRQDEAAVLRKSMEHAVQRGKEQASERDIAAVLLALAGFTVQESEPGKIPYGPVAPGTLVQPSSSAASTTVQIPRETSAPKKQNVSVLEQFGRDLNEEARQGRLVRVIGREEEIQLVTETLCRRTKRNPVLVGPAGVGKTAIAEGLAYRVIEGSVPAMLKNARIIALHPSSLTAGASMAGEVEKRMKAVIAEASKDDVILFIDEIHTIMGAGGIPGATDIASILKPALARGDIACIAATTDEEYRRFIEHDSALERRFQPIRVHEISPEITLNILSDICSELGSRHHISVDENVLPFLIDFGQQFMRNRHFPDKGVDLIEQCFAHAILKGKEVLDLADAQEVAQRMVGMPLALDKRLGSLRSALQDQGLLPGSAVSQLVDRLQVTLRGLDLRTSRPNAVILLSGDVANSSDRLAKTIASTLYGSEERVITIDFSRMWHAEDINLLVGSPPGYVGYSDSLPLHRLAQTPWCVLRFENVDSCHASIREVISQGFYDGWIMDGRGRPIYFSDAVVLMTADVNVQNKNTTGFLTAAAEPGQEDIRRAVEGVIGPDMAERIDLFVYRMEGEAELSVKWLEDHLISDLTHRYLKQGVDLKWDETMLKWLLVQYKDNWSGRDWEKWVDTELSPMIIAHLPTPGALQPHKVIVKMMEGKVQIEE